MASISIVLGLPLKHAGQVGSSLGYGKNMFASSPKTFLAIPHTERLEHVRKNYVGKQPTPLHQECLCTRDTKPDPASMSVCKATWLLLVLLLVLVLLLLQGFLCRDMRQPSQPAGLVALTPEHASRASHLHRRAARRFQVSPWVDTHL